MSRARLTAIGAGLALAAVAALTPGTADAAGSSPGISPSPQKVVTIPKGGSRPACPSGVLCALVKDPTTGGFKDFFLYQCHTYALSNWFDYGDISDHQTGNVTSYLYDKNHKEIQHFKPTTQGALLVYWDDVYYIKNC